MTELAAHRRANASREAKVVREAQRYRGRNYKIIAIVGDSGSGKSTLGNLYCGWEDDPPFRIEHGRREGTLQTTGFADAAKGIYWLDTRGLSARFPHREWMGLLEELGLLDGLILVGYPQQRATDDNGFESFSAYVDAQGFHCLRVFRRDLLSIVAGFPTPHLYEDFVPFDKDTPEPRIVAFIEATRALPPSASFHVVDVPMLTSRVLDLRKKLEAAEQTNVRLQEDNDRLRLHLLEMQRVVQDTTGQLESEREFANRLRNDFSGLETACAMYLQQMLQLRSRFADRKDIKERYYSRKGFNHVLSLVFMLSGQVGAAVLNEELMTYSKEVRRKAVVLRQLLSDTTKRKAAYARKATTPVGTAHTVDDIAVGMPNATDVLPSSAVPPPPLSAPSSAPPSSPPSAPPASAPPSVPPVVPSECLPVDIALVTDDDHGTPSPSTSDYASVRTSSQASQPSLAAMDVPSEESKSSDGSSVWLSDENDETECSSRLSTASEMNCPTPRASAMAAMVQGPATTANHRATPHEVPVLSVTPLSSSMSMAGAPPALIIPGPALTPTS